MGSSAKTGKKIFHRSQEQFWIKLSFGIRHPPAIHQLQCICVGEDSRVPNLQTKFNYLISFKSYGIFSDFVVPMGPCVVPVIPTLSLHCPRCPHIIPIAPRRSPCGPCCPSGPVVPTHVVPIVPVIPVIPMSSLSSPHHLEGPQIIPNPPDSPLDSTYPPLPGEVGGPESLKCYKNWTNWDILILIEDLKFVKTPPLMGGCMGLCMDGWMGGLMGGARSNH